MDQSREAGRRQGALQIYTILSAHGHRRNDSWSLENVSAECSNMAKNHMAGGRPTSGSSSSAPNKSRNRWTAVVCSPLHCMCAADWTDGSRWRQLAAAASVPRRPEPSRAARPLSIRLPVTGGDLPKQWPAKRDPRFRRLGSRDTRRHKTRASHGHGLTGVACRNGTPRAVSPLTAGLLPFLCPGPAVQACVDCKLNSSGDTGISVSGFTSLL